MAGLEAIKNCHDDMIYMVEKYKERREEAVRLFETIDGISLVQPDGAFYLFADMSAIKDKLEYSDSLSIEICNKLLDEYNLLLYQASLLVLMITLDCLMPQILMMYEKVLPA